MNCILLQSYYMLCKGFNTIYIHYLQYQHMYRQDTSCYRHKNHWLKIFRLHILYKLNHCCHPIRNYRNPLDIIHKYQQMYPHNVNQDISYYPHTINQYPLKISHLYTRNKVHYYQCLNHIPYIPLDTIHRILCHYQDIHHQYIHHC